MNNKDWMSTREAAQYLCISKPQVFRLIQNGLLLATKDEDAPVPYYQVNKDSVEIYKLMPKNRGGRPKRKGTEGE